jgi:DNA (cytosine-5)-methyltransferase 1
VTLESRRPIVVDLFAGAGGLSLGFEQAGFDIAAAVEYDPIHAAIHELNFPRTKIICRDIRRVSGAMIRAESGIGNRSVDVVIGGPPCQGFSLIGHRVLTDPRNELVLHFVRIVNELRPKTFMFENVAGMATGKHHALLDELIAGFEDSGYAVRKPYRILNAKQFGVPQDRRRLILLGARRGTTLPSYPDATTVGRDNRKRSAPLELGNGHLPLGPSVMDAIGDLPDIGQYTSLFETDVLAQRPSGGSVYARRLQGRLADPYDFSNPREFDRSVSTGNLRANHTPKSIGRFTRTIPGDTEPTSRFFRLPPEGVCNTLRAGTGSERGAFTSPRPIHPVHARCISVREAARLHSYPDWFRFHKTIWHGFRQIGNSVPPLLARAIARSFVEALGVEVTRPTMKMKLGNEELAHLNMREAAAHFQVSSSVIPGRLRKVAS